MSTTTVKHQHACRKTSPWFSIPKEDKDGAKEDKDGASRSCKLKCLGKILQTEATLTVRVHDKMGRKHVFTANVPAGLQCMDSCSALNLKACLNATWDISGLPEFLQRFARIYYTTSNDRAAPNNALESLLESCKLSKDLRLRTTCSVHKAHSIQGNQWNIDKALISGMVNLALAGRNGGGVTKLRECVQTLLKTRLKNFPGAHACRDVVAKTEATIALFVRQDTAAGVMRAHALRKLNGDWSGREVQVYGRALTADDLAGLARTLVPSTCPLFPRSRWTKGDVAVDWVGLLSSCHFILQDVVPVWIRYLRDPKNGPKPSDFSLDEGEHEDDCGPRGFQRPVQRGVGAPEQAEAADDDAVLVAPEVAAQAAAGEVDWKSLNAASRVKAIDFASMPGLRASVIIMRTTMAPQLHLMNKLLYMSGDKYEQDAVSVRFRGGMQHRILDFARGRVFEGYYEHMYDVMFNPALWEVLAASERTTANNMKTFRSLSKAGGSFCMLLKTPSSSYPFRLFLLLDGTDDEKNQICNENEDCLRDAFAKAFAKTFPGTDMYSETALDDLRVCAATVSTDIAKIECRHAQIRRSCRRNVQTHTRALEQCSQDFIFVRQRTLEWQRRDLREKWTQRRKTRSVVATLPNHTQTDVDLPFAGCNLKLQQI